MDSDGVGVGLCVVDSSAGLSVVVGPPVGAEFYNKVNNERRHDDGGVDVRACVNYMVLRIWRWTQLRLTLIQQSQLAMTLHSLGEYFVSACI